MVQQIFAKLNLIGHKATSAMYQLKFVDKFIFLISNIASTEIDVNIHRGEA